MKIITEEVVLIECMYLDEKRGDVYRVVKYCLSGYIFVSCPPCVLAMDTTNVRGPVFMDGKFVFILFVMVIAGCNIRLGHRPRLIYLAEENQNSSATLAEVKLDATF